ncbi:glycosyltransferase family 2 protein [Dyadobacter psychrotolerans]|uniref:Glycosyltransferase n=1 Tax=Dyadobacter psychrotolerans TaxID=2541721 RepID=A0A4R5DVT8_9BACT|nr:glycosyltransferase [Dyadobacter psychrotolerans]TDE18686.1 glycosyltransferase [Dyadobacter psychrotolerans]
MPETTVLIPAYNCGKYIKETLDSVLKQKYKDYEILIIDDGSTDNTSQVIDTFKNKKIKYLRNSENAGIVETLNHGLKIANSEFIARMDADDVMLGNRLEEQISFLQKNADFGMVGGWYRIMDENGRFLSTSKTHQDSDFLKLGLIFRNQFAHPAVTMRTAIVRELAYDPEFQYCEDHDLWIRFSEVCKVTNLPEQYLSYRWYSGNSCNRKQKELKTAVLRLLSRELDKLKVSHSAQELMLHGAVSFGAGPKLFIAKEKQKELKEWYDKVFSSSVLNERYDKSWLIDFRSKVQQLYCGIQG